MDLRSLLCGFFVISLITGVLDDPATCDLVLLCELQPQGGVPADLTGGRGEAAPGPAGERGAGAAHTGREPQPGGHVRTGTQTLVLGAE